MKRFVKVFLLNNFFQLFLVFFHFFYLFLKVFLVFLHVRYFLFKLFLAVRVLREASVLFFRGVFFSLVLVFSVEAGQISFFEYSRDVLFCLFFLEKIPDFFCFTPG